MTPPSTLGNLLNPIKERVENAKLYSDDHGHDCGALREYCEQELIYAYGITVPKLIKCVEVLNNAVTNMANHCLCDRNVNGFDYHENHRKLGSPKIGARWLSPPDQAKEYLAQAESILRGKG